MDAQTETGRASRRPLKTRQWRSFQSLSKWLGRAGVSPNAISIASILFAAGAATALIFTDRGVSPTAERLLWLAAALGIQLRLLANLLDGMVAVEGGKASPVGELYNEVPDRIADPVILLGAGYAAGSVPMLGALAAVVALFVAYVRALGASVGAGQLFLGPMAKPHRMALLTLVCVIHVVLPSSAMPVHEASGVGLMGAALAVLILGGVLTAWRRLSRISAFLKGSAE